MILTVIKQNIDGMVILFALLFWLCLLLILMIYSIVHGVVKTVKCGDVSYSTDAGSFSQMKEMIKDALPSDRKYKRLLILACVAIFVIYMLIVTPFFTTKLETGNYTNKCEICESNPTTYKCDDAYYCDEHKQNAYNYYEVLIGYGKISSSDSKSDGQMTCKICGREIKPGNFKGNMCKNCYDNYKWAMEALGK